jgi:S-adenosylmethionine-diacylgycerolhomoserine-N-methlytransferase
MSFDAGVRMDAMYRRQRHIYDLSRKFYLFGRDELLDRLPARDGDKVLEIGCGTGRNLVRLARRRPGLALFGVDVSTEMLASSASSLRRAGLADRVRLARAGAEGFDPKAAFGVEAFDVAYFSYVLSMIPDWRSAVETALRALRPGGTLAVVDFADQTNVAPWRRWILLNWLRLFHVHPRTEIERGLREIALREGGVSHERDVLSGYAYILMLRKR